MIIEKKKTSENNGKYIINEKFSFTGNRSNKKSKPSIGFDISKDALFVFTSSN